MEDFENIIAPRLGKKEMKGGTALEAGISSPLTPGSAGITSSFLQVWKREIGSHHPLK